MDIVEEQNEYLVDSFLKFNVEIGTILNDFHPRYGFLAVPLQEATNSLPINLVFNLTSKIHFVLHSLFNARWLHPSLVWCYKGEDQMQRVARL